MRILEDIDDREIRRDVADRQRGKRQRKWEDAAIPGLHKAVCYCHSGAGHGAQSCEDRQLLRPRCGQIQEIQPDASAGKTRCAASGGRVLRQSRM